MPRKSDHEQQEDQDQQEQEQEQEVISAEAEAEEEETETDLWAGIGVYDPFDEEEPGEVNAVIYGQPGSGKTSLVAGAPRCLLLDFERGGRASIVATGNRDTRSVHITSMKQVRQVYRALSSGKHDFLTVALDPIGELQRLMMEDTLKRFPSSRRQYNDLPMQADWNKMLSDLTKLVTMFRALPMHTIVVAHSEIPKHEDDTVAPLVSGKNFKPFLQGAMDLLGYLYVDEDEDGSETRMLRTTATPTINAKNRGGKLDPIIINPNMTEIIEQMGGRIR